MNDRMVRLSHAILPLDAAACDKDKRSMEWQLMVVVHWDAEDTGHETKWWLNSSRAQLCHIH